MMPKQFKFFVQVLENAAQESYKVGHADGEAGKPLDLKQFAMSKASQLQLKNALDKYLKNP
ncbi:MAG: hypothetical protein NVS9B12_13200 [Vulcanimicrobiaceae bacterium]